MPTISPARTSKSIGAAAPRGLQAARPSAAARRSCGSPPGTATRSCGPTIEAISESWSKSVIGAVVTSPPSRRTVTRSPISNISSRWWRDVHDRVALVAQLRGSGRAAPSSRVSDSAVVGSSKISTRGFAPSTFAISTSCWWRARASPTCVSGSSQSRPTRSSIAARLAAQLAGRVTPRRAGQAAHQQVLADRQVGQQAELLVDDADAGRRGPRPG